MTTIQLGTNTRERLKEHGRKGIKVIKVWVVVLPYDDGGAAGDFIQEIFMNEVDADKFIEADKKRWGYSDMKKILWEVK